MAIVYQKREKITDVVCTKCPYCEEKISDISTNGDQHVAAGSLARHIRYGNCEGVKQRYPGWGNNVE